MKKFRLLWLLIAAFLIGYVYAAFVYNGVWTKLFEGLKTIHFFMYIVWLLVTFLVTLTVHELGHFFAFLSQGVKLRALYILICVFYKDQKGWHFTIKPKLWVLIGGLVVPDLGEITDDETYEKTRQKFAKSLIAAPIVTLVFAALMMILFVTLILFSNHHAFNGIIFLTTFYTMLLTMLYVYTFKLSNAMFYGDFVAYKKMKTDPVFALAQLNQYTMFSLNESRETDLYLWHKIKDQLKTTSLKNGLIHMMLIMSYIEGLITYDLPTDQHVHLKLSRLQLNPYTRTEQGVTMLYDLAHYHYKVKDPEKAYMIYNYIQERASKKIDEKTLEYLKKRTMHIMHIEDQLAYLTQIEDVNVGQAWIFEVLMDVDKMMESQYEKLPFVPYACEVHLENEPLIESE